jgi:hypothetical protein
MFRTPILAVTAVAALAMALPSIYGAAAFVGPAVAQSLSSSSTSSASTPPDTNDPGPGPNDPGGNADGGPAPSPEETIAKMETVCNGALSGLHKLSAKVVAAFGGEANVVPVCNNGLGKKASIDGSQALPLQNVIAANPDLMAALKAAGFGADSVVGIVMINGQATLYVHSLVRS